VDRVESRSRGKVLQARKISLLLGSLYLPPSQIHITTNHRTTLSTQLFSSRRTSSLNASTSCQQSSGRRSFSRRQRTTSPRAFSTVSGNGRSCFRLSRRARSASTSADTACLSSCVCVSFLSVNSEAFSRAAFSAALSCADSFFNSSDTRAWIASSRCCARETSD